MSAGREPRREPPRAVRSQALIAVFVFGVVASPVALALAVPLALACRRARRALVLLALAGLVATAVVAPLALVGARAGLAAFAAAQNQRQPPLLARVRGAPPVPPDWAAGARAAWPHVRAGWLLLIPLAPALALLIELVRPRTLVEQHGSAEGRSRRMLERRRRAAERRAAASVRGAALGPNSDVAMLGARMAGGERVLPERHGAVGLPLDWLGRPTLVIGPSGSGKTETLLRLAYGAAAVGRWRVYYIDAKADADSAGRFAGLMAQAGLRCAVFPQTSLDPWRGDARAIYNRLIELVGFATEGDGAFYRDVAKRCLWLACCAEAEPPRSSAALLERLAPDRLLALDAARGELAKLAPRDLSGVSLRYGAFFDSLAGALDGGYSFEDVDAAYLMLDSLALKEDAQSLARLVVEDFAHFATQRKPRSQRALLIIDELSAIADAARVVDLVERMRSFGVGVVLAPQVESGMGGDESVSDRIVQNAETVILHAVKRPEPLIELAGTRRVVETSAQHERGTATGAGSGRVQHAFKVDPNEVRGLRPGECFVIRRGAAVRVQVARAPAVAPLDVARSAEPGPKPSPARVPLSRPAADEDALRL